MAEYKNYGLQNVSPDSIRVDPPLDDHDWETTKDGGGGTRREDIDACIDRLPEVSAAVERGAAPHDFERMRESADPHERAVGDSYGMFYEHPIKVERDGGGLVTGQDGRHRLQRLQDRGERVAPAEVRAPADDPEFAGRPYDAARVPAREHTRWEDDMGGERRGYVPDEYRAEAPEVYRNPDVKNVDAHLPHERAAAQGQPSDAQSQQTDASSQQRADTAGPDRLDGRPGGADPLSGTEAAAASDAKRDPMDGGDARAPAAARDAPEKFEAPSAFG
jgi:hypothetical protein